MRLSRLFCLALVLPALGACASDRAAPAPVAAAPARPSAPPPIVLSVRSQDDMGVRPTLRPDLAPESGSDSAAVLAARSAMAQGRSDVALDYLSKAPGLMDDPVVRGRAFSAALLNGEVSRAAQLAPAEPGDDTDLYRLGRLTQVVEAMASGRGQDAVALLAGDVVGYPHRAAAQLLAPWAAAMADDTQGALARPTMAGDRFVEVFGRLGHAQLSERFGKFEDAEADYKALSGMRAAGDLYQLDYGAFLERRGRQADAVAVYDGLLVRAPGDHAAGLARARALAKKRPPAMPTLAQGAANALTGPAASALGDRRNQSGMAYLRLVLRLDPNRTDALVLIGDMLQARGDADGARSIYARIPKTSAQYLQARAKLAWSFQNGGDGAQALTIARETAKAHPGDQDSQFALVSLLRANGRHGEAVTVVDGLIARAGDHPDWRLYYLRATALDAAGRWPEAERDLKTALAISPNEPILLNFLGYSWVSRGENLPEGLAMVKRAAQANPRSGSMLDSLGWAYFRNGEFKLAVETLERAVMLEPGDPELNNHLGDAYWQVGRKDEARFQWTRVLTLEPDEAIRKDAERKLKEGLGAPGGATPAIASAPVSATQP